MTDEFKSTKQQQPLGSDVGSNTALDAMRSVSALPLNAPFTWLAKAVADVHACRYLSLIYGVCFVIMGLGVNRAHAGNQTLALAVAAGFLFAGPFLATGLYELSRQIQANEPRDLMLSLFAWCRNPAAFGRFAAFLSAVMVIWLLLSVPLFDTLSNGLSAKAAILFLVWFSLALVVFMASVVSIPMMLENGVSAQQAIKFSVSSCLANWKMHTLWALLIVTLIGGSLILNYWPLLITGPIVGHATWHAYQAHCSRQIDPPAIA